jgi:predicted glycosyltransferase
MERSELSIGASRRDGVGTVSASSWRGQPGRFLLYSHDGLGLGHVRRNLAIAGALTELEPRASVLLATSADEAPMLSMPTGVDILKLPGLRKLGNERYGARRLPISAAEFATVRAQILRAAVESFRPHVLLVDKHPLGPGEELRPALQVARTEGVRAVLGLRDILDQPATVASEWTPGAIFDQIERYYDRVLVYGQPHIFDPVREYGFPDPVAAMTSFCGYVFRPASGPAPDEVPEELGRDPRTRPLVLATAGGGEDGFALLATFIKAVAGRPWDAIVVSGPQCGPEEAQRLRGLAAEARVGFRTFVPRLSGAFGALDALVCMGGYNTLVESAAARVPTVCVPRVRPRREQLLRAQAFARLGLLRLLEPHRLKAPLLSEAIGRTLEDGRAPRVDGENGAIDLHGALRAAGQLLDLAQGAPPRRWFDVAVR